MAGENQTEEIKEQLIAQIENSQLENKDLVKQHIQKLDEKGLKDFLKQNNLEFKDGELRQGSSESPSKSPSQGPSCIFCSIMNNETPSYKLSENKKAIAILEIMPVSKGHSIIVPREHTTIEKLPKSVLSLSQKIAKKIKTKLKPEDVKIETASVQDHAIINVIPFYKDKKLEKRKASEEGLKELQSLLGSKKRSPRKTKQKEDKPATKINLPKISFRIP